MSAGREYMGRIVGMSNAEYHASPGISSSGLKELAKTPADFHAYLTEPRKQTDAMRIGSAMHTLVLEPQKFEQEYAISPACNANTKAGKATLESFAAKNEGKTILSMDEYSLANEMADAIRCYELAAALLDKPGEAETSCYWEENGVLCKCRPDWLTHDGWLVDLKSTKDESAAGFPRESERYGYHISAGFYRRGVEFVTGTPIQGFVFIAVRNKRPHLVACHLAAEDFLYAGNARASELLDLYRKCKQEDEWPGHPNELIPLSRPKWAV